MYMWYQVNLQVISKLCYYEGGYNTECLGANLYLPVISRYFASQTRGGRKEVNIFIWGLMEIAGMMKSWILGRIIEISTKKFTGYFRKKVGFCVLSWFFQGN